jgi:hypothetical protein
MSLILSGTDGLSDVDGTAATPAIRGTDANTGIFFPAADTIAFAEGGAEVARFDSAGNFGLGVTPSAWGSSVKAIQIGARTGVWNLSDNTYLSTNSYFDGTNSRYIGTQFATMYSQQNDGAHKFYVAPSGTAGNAITFTQAMTLDASGNLGVGTTSPAAKAEVVSSTGAQFIGTFRTGDSTAANNSGCGFYGVSSATAGSRQASMWLDADGANFAGGDYFYILKTGNSGNVDLIQASNAAITFQTNTTERARIDTSGNLLVGTTTNFSTRLVSFATNNAFGAINTTSGSTTTYIWNQGTSGNNIFTEYATETSAYTARGNITYNRAGGLVAYNTTSDYRAKDISGPVTGSGSLIDSVPVYMGTMKGATQERPMFIAHETPVYAHTGEKDAVDKDGNPIYQQMDVSALVPVMWAEIQSLRKRLAALESA